MTEAPYEKEEKKTESIVDLLKNHFITGMGILNSLIPSEQRATLISVNSMCFSIAMIIIFPVVGFISDRIGLGKSLLGIGFVLVGFTLLWREKVTA